LSDPDKKERRSGWDRRQFSYAFHIPERRQGGDRRKNQIGFKPAAPVMELNLDNCSKPQPQSHE